MTMSHNPTTDPFEPGPVDIDGGAARFDFAHTRVFGPDPDVPLTDPASALETLIAAARAGTGAALADLAAIEARFPRVVPGDQPTDWPRSWGMLIATVSHRFEQVLDDLTAVAQLQRAGLARSGWPVLEQAVATTQRMAALITAGDDHVLDEARRSTAAWHDLLEHLPAVPGAAAAAVSTVPDLSAAADRQANETADAGEAPDLRKPGGAEKVMEMITDLPGWCGLTETLGEAPTAAHPHPFEIAWSDAVHADEKAMFTADTETLTRSLPLVLTMLAASRLARVHVPGAVQMGPEALLAGSGVPGGLDAPGIVETQARLAIAVLGLAIEFAAPAEQEFRALRTFHGTDPRFPDDLADDEGGAAEL